MLACCCCRRLKLGDFLIFPFPSLRALPLDYLRMLDTVIPFAAANIHPHPSPSILSFSLLPFCLYFLVFTVLIYRTQRLICYWSEDESSHCK